MDNHTAERIALFRFGVIAPLVDRHLSRGERERIIDQIVSSTWQIPGSRHTSALQQRKSSRTTGISIHDGQAAVRSPARLMWNPK